MALADGQRAMELNGVEVASGPALVSNYPTTGRSGSITRDGESPLQVVLSSSGTGRRAIGPADGESFRAATEKPTERHAPRPPRL